MINKLLPYLKSKTVWGGILMFVNNILRASGYQILDDAMIQQVIQLVIDGIGIVGVVYGRMKAKGPLDASTPAA